MNTFRITNWQYNIMLKQVQENYPQESGGFLGGQDFFIKGVLPVFNQHLYDKTTTFAITSEDIQRAHDFFTMNQLTYYGVYHSHPTEPAYPSEADLRTGNPYLFIFGLRRFNSPEFNAFQVKGTQYEELKIELVDDRVIVGKKTGINSSLKPSGGDLIYEAKRLQHMFDDIRNERIQYEKYSSAVPYNMLGFNTVA